jgi:predicted ATPase
MRLAVRQARYVNFVDAIYSQRLRVRYIAAARQFDMFSQGENVFSAAWRKLFFHFDNLCNIKE